MTGAEAVSVAEVISKFESKISKAFSFVSDEVRQFINNGVEDYLTIQYQKFAFTKTFLHRDEPVDFYQVFYPVTLQSRKGCIKTGDLSEFLINYQFVGLIGAAGSGKTMLMKHIFLTAFNSIYKIPIVIELRNLNKYPGTLTDYLFKTILGNKLAKNDTIMERLLQNGSFIFLLDSYDEIYSDKKQRITDEIDEFIDSNNNNSFVITSRPGANLESLPRFYSYQVQPLTMEDINNFVDAQLLYYEDKELIQKIKDIIQLPEDKDYISFIKNPLLLSMFILTYKDHPELPKMKSTFYYNVYDTLVTKHDTITKKGGYQHERKSGLQKDEIFNFLKFFSLQSLFQGNFSFEEPTFNSLADKVKANLKIKCDNDKLLEDLLVSLNILLRDGNMLTFPHKSIQEYFAAECVASQGQEFKKKVYEEKLNGYFFRSTGALNNFWDMLVELDKENFYKLFVIPTTKRVLVEYGYSDKIDPIILSANFLTISGYRHNLALENGIFTPTMGAGHRNVSGLYVALMLVKRNNPFFLLHQSDIDKNQDLLQALLKAGQLKSREQKNGTLLYELRYSEIDSDNLYSFLEGTSLSERINTLFRTIKSKLEQEERELDEEVKSKVSFLD